MTSDVLAVRIKLPPEALVPLLLGTGALLVLVFAGSALKAWKERNPGPARTFGLVVGVALTGAALFFLARCLTNQSDPNNEGTGQLSFIDPLAAGFVAAIGALFWRFGDRPKVGQFGGLAVGALMFAKPFVWPVIRVWHGEHGLSDHARGLMDPEHLVFLGAGVVVMLTAAVAGARKA